MARAGASRAVGIASPLCGPLRARPPGCGETRRVLRAVVLPAGSAGSGPVSPPGAPPVSPLLPQPGRVDQPSCPEHLKATNSRSSVSGCPAPSFASPAGRTLRGERRPSPNLGHPLSAALVSSAVNRQTQGAASARGLEPTAKAHYPSFAFLSCPFGYQRAWGTLQRGLGLVDGGPRLYLMAEASPLAGPATGLEAAQ